MVKITNSLKRFIFSKPEAYHTQEYCLQHCTITTETSQGLGVWLSGGTLTCLACVKHKLKKKENCKELVKALGAEPGVLCLIPGPQIVEGKKGHLKVVPGPPHTCRATHQTKQTGKQTLKTQEDRLISTHKVTRI